MREAEWIRPTPRQSGWPALVAISSIGQPDAVDEYVDGVCVCEWLFTTGDSVMPRREPFLREKAPRGLVRLL